jgi:hypothetical protein
VGGVRIKPSAAALLVCAFGGLGHAGVLPRVPTPAAVRAFRGDLSARWACDVATRRALLSDGDAERLYADAQAACPAARDPLPGS